MQKFRRAAIVGLGLCGTALVAGWAGAAAAQSGGIEGMNAGSNFWFEDYAERHRWRDRDENPTGFGRPGEYWSVPTGSRIFRGKRPSAQAVLKPSDTTATTTEAKPQAAPAEKTAQPIE